MLVNSKTPAVAALVKKWHSSQAATKLGKQRVQNTFEGYLAHEVIEPAVQHAVGQLILYYHTYIKMVELGHSFAYGSEMGGQSAYRVIIGRIQSAKSLALLTEPMYGIRISTSDEGDLIREGRFIAGRRYSIPIQWERSLVANYGWSSSQPFFVIPPESTVSPDQNQEKNLALDVSSLGRKLFSHDRGPLDWATKYELAIGTKDVRRWLAHNKSFDAIKQLAKL
jgi:hypothetical protein